ncbi:carboxymuconolactone decarboxylase family protein [Marinobacter sp. C2H3]|uniref:carboxymuconolactone decarboxylase family protein n=1 Tax=Marinobacter sp. C2H3 TaxID=3119003 RepID=UPI00300F37CF
MSHRIDFFKACPGGVKTMLAVEEYVATSTIERPLAELVKLRASQINGCAYCVNMHVRDARKGGETAQRLDTLVAWRETPFFTKRERAALAWTEALTLVATTQAPDSAYEAARAEFSDAELADLTLLIGAINLWNRIAVGFRKPLD